MRPLVGAAPRPPLATPLALCYGTVVCPVLSCLSVCELGVLWPNGWMDQDETWQAGRPPLPWPQYVRWGPTSPSPKGNSPQFSAHICCGKMAGWIKMPLGMEVGFGPGDFVLDGDPATPKKGHSPPFSTHVYCGQTAVCIDQDTIWYGGRHQPRRHCVRWGLLPHVKGHSSPLHFGPCLLWPNGWMDQDTTWYGRRPRPRRCVRCRPSPFHFWPMSIVAKRPPSQQLLGSLFIYCW